MNRHIDRIYQIKKLHNINNDYESVGDMYKNIHKKEPYIFTITTSNAIGDSVTSEPTADIVPIISPTISDFTVTNSVTNNLPSLNCSITVSNNGSSITSFTITTGTSTLSIDPTKSSSTNTSGLNYLSLVLPSGGAGSSGTYTFTITDISQNTSYIFNATATNTVGTSSGVSSSQITTNSVPGVPTNVTAVSGDKQCIVSFINPTNIGGSPITKFTVTSSPGNIISTGNTTPITVRGLTNGTAYTFKVTATNELGEGPVSSSSNSVIPSGPAIAPTSISATSNENNQSVVSFSGHDENGSSITKYQVNARTSSGEVLTSSNDTGSPITITGLTNGTSYIIDVSVTNSNGTTTSNATATAIPATKPNKITSVTPTSGSKLITLKFPEPSNNGSPITQYKISAYYTQIDSADRSVTLQEDILVSPTDLNYSKDDSGNVSIILYTKSNNAKFVLDTSISNNTPLQQVSGTTSPLQQVSGTTTTAPTISKSIQPYERVPLLYYPIGNEREGYYNNVKTTNQKYNKFRNILVIILFIFVILYFLMNNKK